MPDPDAPRNPGPRPPAFAFPWAEANAALKALQLAIAEHRTFARIHVQAVAAAYVDFRGPARQKFEHVFDDAIGRWNVNLHALERVEQTLKSSLAQARLGQTDRTRAIAAWEGKREAYLRYREAANGAA